MTFRPDPKPEPSPKKKRARINQISEKRKEQFKIYSVRRKLFLEANPICPITGEKTVDIHHMRGRTGTLYLDENYWLAVSRDGHEKIENNPEWAKENGYSLNRI